MENSRIREKGEELKRAEELDLQEAQKQSSSISKKEGRCMILRLKHFTHVLLHGAKTGGQSPLQALIALSQRVISENDFILVGATGG